jgi:hypothetical protein
MSHLHNARNVREIFLCTNSSLSKFKGDCDKRRELWDCWLLLLGPIDTRVFVWAH